MAFDYAALAAQKYPIGSTVRDAPIPITIGGVVPQFENRFVSLQEVVYHKEGGSFHEARSVVIMPDGMLVLPVTNDGKIVLVKVLRPGVNRWCWEAPQERMDAGDHTIADAAIRCAREEVGLTEGSFTTTLLSPVASMPDRVTEMTYSVVIEGTFDFESRIDKGEVMEGCIAAFSLAEVKRMMLYGEIVCPCAISALAKYLWLKEGV